MSTDPTWESDIRSLFREVDVACMRGRGVLLDDYDFVSSQAKTILEVVTDGFMPPDESWGPEKLDLFRAWIDAGAPRGEPPAPAPRIAPEDLAWTRTTAPLATSRYDDIDFLTPRLGWAVNSNGQVLQTTDGGDNWRIVRPFFGSPGRPDYLRTVAFRDERNGWIGTTSGASPLYRTTDGGLTWAVVALPAGAPQKVCGLQVLGDVVVAAGTNDPRFDASFVRSADGGASWTVTPMDAHAEALIDLHFFNDSEGYVVGGKSIDGRRRRDSLRPVVLHTTDGGASWRNVAATDSLPQGEWGWKIQFLGRDVGFVSLENMRDGAILKTEDAGQTWTRHRINDPQGNQNVEGLGFLTPAWGWVGGWGNAGFDKGYSSETRDGGLNWTDANHVGGFINRFVLFPDEQPPVGFAAGKGVYRLGPAPPGRALLSRAVVEEAPMPTAIRVDAFEPGEQVQVSVWSPFSDLLRVFEASVPEDGEIAWDGRDQLEAPLGAGAYMWRAESPRAVQGGLVHKPTTAE